MTVAILSRKMAEPKTTSVKLTMEAVEAARIAAAFRGKTLYEYASEVLLAAANRDIEEGYRERQAGSPARPKKGGKGKVESG